MKRIGRLLFVATLLPGCSTFAGPLEPTVIVSKAADAVKVAVEAAKLAGGQGEVAMLGKECEKAGRHLDTAATAIQVATDISRAVGDVCDGVGVEIPECRQWPAINALIGEIAPVVAASLLEFRELCIAASE